MQAWQDAANMRLPRQYNQDPALRVSATVAHEKGRLSPEHRVSSEGAFGRRGELSGPSHAAALKAVSRAIEELRA